MNVGPRVFKIFGFECALIEKYNKLKFNKYKIKITVRIVSRLDFWQEHWHIHTLSRTHKFIGWEMVVKRPKLGANQSPPSNVDSVFELLWWYKSTSLVLRSLKVLFFIHSMINEHRKASVQRSWEETKTCLENNLSRCHEFHADCLVGSCEKPVTNRLMCNTVSAKAAN